MNSEQSDCLRKIVINEPMPELSLTSKRVKEQEEGSKGEEKKKTIKKTQLNLIVA